MRQIRNAFTAQVLLSVTAFAQQFTFSVVGGANLTNHFPVTEYRTPADAYGNAESLFRHRSGGRSQIFGGEVEARLTERLSFAAGLLHRPMKSEILFEEFPVGGAPAKSVTQHTAVRAWQFPLLLKWRLGEVAGMAPFVAGGVSFRTQEEAGAVEPSQRGYSVGAGVMMGWKKLRVSPALRYTRWAREQVWPKYATKRDQVELMTTIGVATGQGRSGAIGAEWLRLGLLGGIPLTAGFTSPRGAWLAGTAPKIDERFRYSAGFAVEARMRDRWALEVDGIYRPLRVKGTKPERQTESSVLTWLVPVLVKHLWREEGWRPFVSGGPSFRLSGNLNGAAPSGFGGTMGAGVEHKMGRRMTAALEFRYTRWRQDRPFLRTNQNTGEVLAAVRF